MLNFFKKPKKEPKDLKEVLNYLEKVEKDLKTASQDLENLKERNQSNLQKVAMVRYNPFAEVGGNQSFSIALLDGNNDGVVLTSHYGREFHRVYAKPVKGGSSEYSLSKEEKEAIARATGSGNSKSQIPNSK